MYLEGKLLYIAIPPICQGGWLYSHFPGGVYYIAIFPPIQVRGKWLCSHFSGEGVAVGENGSIAPATRR